MNENISIVVSAIVATLLVVLLPLLNILDRQDNMSYNVVLTLTTNFVDDVRSKGFIDKESYYKYLEKIANTGNVYDITVEAHKKILFETDDTTDPKYEEDTIIYNKHDIETELNSGSGVYKFEVGDELYIKIYNTNIPSSSVLYRFLANASKYTVVNINYGGVVNKVNQEEYEKSIKDYEHIPNISIGVPKNESGQTPGVTNYLGTYQYYFDLADSENRSITLNVVLKNFNIFSDTDNNEISVDKLKEYIYIKGMDSYTITILDASGNTLSEISTTDGKCSFKIKLTGINIDTTYNAVSVIIYPGLGESDDKIISKGMESVKFLIINDYNMYSMEFEGPFYGNGNKVKQVGTGNIIVYKKTTFDQDIFFNLKYTSIQDTESNITTAIQNYLNVYFNGYDRGKLIPRSLFYSGDPTMTSYNDLYNFGIVKIPLKHSATSTTAGYLSMPDSWIIAQDNGGDVQAKGGDSNKYVVKADDEAPIGDLIVKKSKTDLAQYVSGNYEVGSLDIYLDTSNISDSESGLYKITINDTDNTKTYEFKEANSLNIPWKFPDTISSGNIISINYKVEDNVGNIMDKTVSVKYIKTIISDFWLTQGIQRSGLILDTNTWIKQNDLNIHIDTEPLGSFDVITQAFLNNDFKEEFSYSGYATSNTEYDKTGWIPDGGTILTSGIWKVLVKTDNAGTTSEKEKEYKIDNNEPVVNLNSSYTSQPTAPVYGYVREVTVPIEIRDLHSGIGDISYVFNNSSYYYHMAGDITWNNISFITSSLGEYGERATPNITSGNQTGEYYLHLRVSDIVSNVFITSTGFGPYKLDKSSPIIGTGINYSTNKINVNITDMESGIKSINYIVRDLGESEEDSSTWYHIEEMINIGVLSWDNQINYNYTGNIADKIDNWSGAITLQPNKYLWIKTEDNLRNVEKAIIYMGCDKPTITFKVGDEIGTDEVGILAQITTYSNAKVTKAEYGWSDSETEPITWNGYTSDISGDNIVGKSGLITGSKFNIEDVNPNSIYYLYVRVTDECNNVTIKHIKVNRTLPEIGINTSADIHTIGNTYWLAHYLGNDASFNYTIPLGVKTNVDYNLHSISIKESGVAGSGATVSGSFGAGQNYSVNVPYGVTQAGVKTVANGFEITAIDKLGNTSKLNTTQFKFYTMKIEYSYEVFSILTSGNDMMVSSNVATTTNHENIIGVRLRIDQNIVGVPPNNAIVIMSYLKESTITVNGYWWNTSKKATKTYNNTFGSTEQVGKETLSGYASNNEMHYNTFHYINFSSEFKVRNLLTRKDKYIINVSPTIKEYKDGSVIRTIDLPTKTVYYLTGGRTNTIDD